MDETTGIMKTLRSIPDTAKGFWGRLTPGRRRLVIILAILSLLGAGILTAVLNTTRYAVLYTNLTPADAGAIMQKLQELKVNAKTQGSDTILVPEEQVDRLRMDLAVAGFPKSTVSLDILQLGSGFGMTEEDKAIYRRYQLAQDLQHSIETFDSVAEARVSLYIPEESAFLIQDQYRPASAAILVTLHPGRSLSAGNVQAISELVCKSVPGLKPEGVSIIDSNMNVLNTDIDSGEMVTQDQLAMEQQVSERLKKQVLAMLQPIFGMDKVLAEVSVTLDFDEQVVDSIRFEPLPDASTGIIASIDKIREVANRATQDAAEPGTGNNGADVPVYPIVAVDDTIYEKNSEKITYEINTIKEHLVKAKGSVRHLSVSVILDSSVSQEADYRENVRKLVATAVGVSEETITVESMPFLGQAAAGDHWERYQQISEQAMQWEKNRFYILLGAGLLAFLTLMAVIVRLVRGTRSHEDEVASVFPSLQRQAAAAAPSGANFDVLVSDGDLPEQRTPDERDIVARYVDRSPELVASILRGWLSEEQG